MYKAMIKLLSTASTLAFFIALTSASSASWATTYQPEEPAALNKYKKY